MTVIDDLLALVDRLTGRGQQPIVHREYPTPTEQRDAWVRRNGPDEGESDE